ncbi:hypothetical protein A5893_14330 [Pedobacter psychrophilus]|uniref:Methyltransferase FkbM domain-containing protein n=1 Tax=Pedobacter psychrophilus TaxID=1826909 RepID=A0A179DC25_9SPHI|nr:FkbM family methyltransferase [Pedobacter psychrophilus]OAQ38587.1 hypothetical protein A5893_14330 [Pedobacter psychrophilus]
MLQSLKIKLWIFLTSDRIGGLIVKNFIKDGFIKTSAGLIKVGNLASKPISLLFWGLYEREDIYFIKKYLQPSVPAIEFGASLGVTTTQICKKVGTNTKVVSVEANPNLYANLLETKKKNNLFNLEIISAAVDYSGNDKIGFSVNESTLSSSKNPDDINTFVSAITLKDIVKKHLFTEYSLVCDIEGAEIELLLFEDSSEAILGCKTIIIELHETSFKNRAYTINELKNLFINKFSMNIIDQKATTFVFEKIKS